MPVKLRAHASAKAAYRTSWSQRSNILRLSWVSLAISFLLVTADLQFHFKGAPGHVLHKLDELILSVAYVAILRLYILNEDSAGGRNFYFRIGRREIVYALWTLFINLFISVIDKKIWPDPKTLETFFALIIEYGMPFLGAIFMCILYLTWPYLAAAEKPIFREFNDLNKAVKGNVESILVTLFYIFLPYVIASFIYHHFYHDDKTTIPVLHYLRIYLLHAIYCACNIIQLSFMAEAYTKIWLSRPR